MMVTMSSLVTEVLAFLRCSLLSRLYAYVGHVVSTFVLDALRWAAAAVHSRPKPHKCQDKKKGNTVVLGPARAGTDNGGLSYLILMTIETYSYVEVFF